MSEASVHELTRRRAERWYRSGQITQERYIEIVQEANRAEQAEIRTLQNAIKQDRLNR